MSLEMYHLLLFYVDVDFKKVLENALTFETDAVLGIFCLSRFHLRERTHDVESVTRIPFQYKFMGFA